MSLEEAHSGLQLKVYEEAFARHAAYTGEQKETQREWQEFRAVESWINPEGWNIAAEARAVSSNTGRTIDQHVKWQERTSLPQHVR